MSDLNFQGKWHLWRAPVTRPDGADDSAGGEPTTTRLLIAGVGTQKRYFMQPGLLPIPGTTITVSSGVFTAAPAGDPANRIRFAANTFSRYSPCQLDIVILQSPSLGITGVTTVKAGNDDNNRRDIYVTSDPFNGANPNDVVLTLKVGTRVIDVSRWSSIGVQVFGKDTDGDILGMMISGWGGSSEDRHGPNNQGVGTLLHKSQVKLGPRTTTIVDASAVSAYLAPNAEAGVWTTTAEWHQAKEYDYTATVSDGDSAVAGANVAGATNVGCTAATFNQGYLVLPTLGHQYLLCELYGFSSWIGSGTGKATEAGVLWRGLGRGDIA